MEYVFLHGFSERVPALHIKLRRNVKSICCRANSLSIFRAFERLVYNI